MKIDELAERVSEILPLHSYSQAEHSGYIHLGFECDHETAKKVAKATLGDDTVHLSANISVNLENDKLIYFVHFSPSNAGNFLYMMEKVFLGYSLSRVNVLLPNSGEFARVLDGDRKQEVVDIIYDYLNRYTLYDLKLSKTFDTIVFSGEGWDENARKYFKIGFQGMELKLDNRTQIHFLGAYDY